MPLSMGVGAIFDRGGKENLGAHMGPRTAEWGPQGRGPNNHNVACLPRTRFSGPILSYFFGLNGIKLIPQRRLGPS